MIFRNSLVREFVHSALATFFVLLGITMSVQLVRLLGQAASGAITTSAVAALLGFALLNYAAVLLSLTVFIAVLMTLTRSYRDSEMVVWFACGLGLTQWIRPVLAFALPLVAVVALLSLVLSPWAVAKSEELRQLIDSRPDVSAVSPGVFRESRRAERVYFVEEVAGTQDLVANIFVSSTQHGRHGVMVAARGFQEAGQDGERYLVLLNGRRYEDEPGGAGYRIYEFERYAMRIEATAARVERAPTTKSASTIELLRAWTPAHRAEFAWRVGLPVSALVLALLAIPLSFVNPRAGRSMNLLVALLIYMTYSNLLSIAQAAISQSRLGLGAGLVGVHAAMLAVLAALFYRRLSVFSIFRLLR
jgi:lipopolysaccharide export system permease protein